MSATSLLRKTREKLSEVWERMGGVPDCPACGGTGEPSEKYVSWAIRVWWKGREYWVCHHCEGRGKV